MAGDFRSKTIPLSKTTKFIVDNRGRTAPTDEYGVPLIATNCISNDQLYPTYEKLRFVTKETYENWFRSHPLPGDIILTNKGSQNGAICLVPDPVDFVIAQDMVALRADEKIIDPLFLFAALRSADVQREIKNLDVSGVIPHFKKTDFDKLHLPYPERDVQEVIGRIYYDFCVKIEVNRRMNATLEAMARALFQSWFVDFDPVRAKLDGLQPFGFDPDIAALFPAHFEESALGPIPQGWEFGRLDDVLTLQRGFDLPTPDRTHGKYPVMAASGPNGCHDKFMVRGPGVTTGRSGVLGRVFFIHGDFWPLNTSLWVKEFKRVSTAYAFHLLRGLDFEMFNAGSAVPTLNRNHVHNLPVVIPPKSIIEAFDSQVMPLMNRQKANEDQSNTLATLRDTLLLKLLSGELTITPSN